MEHEKKAQSKLIGDESRFYNSYPSNKGGQVDSRVAIGLFEYLDQFIGCAFSPANELISNFDKDYEEGGLLFYTDEEKTLICKVNFKSRLDKEKTSEMVAYLFEIAYDVAMCPMNNVSQSPGFEGCGLFTTS